MAPGEQHKSWDPNYCLLTSLIKADLHFHEWLAAGRKENWAAGQGERSGRVCQNSPCSCSGTLGVHLGLPRLVWSMSLGLSVMQHCGFFFPFSSPPCPAPDVLLQKKKSQGFGVKWKERFAWVFLPDSHPNRSFINFINAQKCTKMLNPSLSGICTDSCLLELSQ